jgi:hypothetical protein
MNRCGPASVLMFGVCLGAAAMFGPTAASGPRGGTDAGPEPARAGAFRVRASTIRAGAAGQITRPLLQPDLHAQPRGYVAYRANAPLSVDGRLDEPAWQAAPWTDTFIDIEGDTKPRPRHVTRARMLWDDTYFYIGADLVEPHLWATLTDHDSVIFRDNDFEVFIDPNGDNHEYYELEINALGTTWDLLLPKPYKDDGKAVNGWEIAGLKSAVRLEGTLNDPRDTDRGWSVELALPWKALGELARRPSPPRDGDQWRVNFSRVQWELDVAGGKYQKRPKTPEFNWVWSPQHVIDMHRPERWGYVQFSTAAPGSAKFAGDGSSLIRNYLHQLYYLQKDYRKAHGRWARNLRELNFVPHRIDDRRPDDGQLSDPELHTAGDQFQFTIVQGWNSTRPVRWHIRQDSLIWSNDK